jgi:serine/threonine protein kinase
MAVTRPALPSRYAVPEPIASGGMGDVYRATDATLGRTVAVKVLSERWASHDEFHTRFIREARTAANLSGEPHVISIYDVSETDDGLPFIVMEYATHGTVAERLQRGPVAPEEALRWLGQAARALDSAHARGVVHRDVKPANLLIADDETIRVSDFGIARAADQDTLTAVGSVLGSVGYMAPEQARGEPTSPASDRYALACVAFELLTGGGRSSATARRPRPRPTRRRRRRRHARSSRPCRRGSTASSRKRSRSSPESDTQPVRRSSPISARRSRRPPRRPPWSPLRRGRSTARAATRRGLGEP